jgi:hypothetical protein
MGAGGAPCGMGLLDALLGSHAPLLATVTSDPGEPEMLKGRTGTNNPTRRVPALLPGAETSLGTPKPERTSDPSELSIISCWTAVGCGFFQFSNNFIYHMTLIPL